MSFLAGNLHALASQGSMVRSVSLIFVGSAYEFYAKADMYTRPEIESITHSPSAGKDHCHLRNGVNLMQFSFLQ